MNYDKLTTEHNPKFIENVTLKLINYNKHNAINGSFSLAEDVQEFEISNRILSRRRNGKQWQMYNITINGCAMLDNSLGKSNPIFDIVMKEIRKCVINLPKRCPLKKGTVISILNLHYNEDMFPPYLPSGTFDSVYMLTTRNTVGLKILTTSYIEARNSEKHRRRKLK
ncbi:uncharacterized protein LOC133323234 [Musca vetustissima]|uniref:uncharacterized protein LOC133323234 n=1 Tax=Musca vetustissima TaxID=27455 RepID=UPI002AB5EE46|nr:uncharacterized protein LOC133323234 [Musca vetustissima]